MATTHNAVGDDALRHACATGAALSYQAAGELTRDLIAHARAELSSGR